MADDALDPVMASGTALSPDPELPYVQRNIIEYYNKV